MTKVELRPAYVWTCEHCGRDNFEYGLVPEFSPEEEQELREEHGITPWEQGDFIAAPTQVNCMHCGESFDTEHYGEE